MKTDKELVQEYWDKEPCDSTGLTFPEGSLEFFEEMEERRYRGQAFIHAFAQFTRWRGKRVLEVGCGCGTDLLQFARAEAEVYGIDFSQHSVELTKKHLEFYGLQAEVTQGDGEGLPFPDNYFDLVYCWGVIHHAPHPSKVVAETYRVLKPGGCIKAMVYYRWSPFWLVKVWFRDAFLRGKIFASLSGVISEHWESPGTQAFTMGQIKTLFHQFAQLKFLPAPCWETDFLKRQGFPWLASLYPHRFAAFMAVEGRKSNKLDHK